MNHWTVRTDDGITLLNPGGQLVTLAYRKVGELLVALLKAPERASPRGELGALLWPGSAAVPQGTNLRQAIKKLRDTIGTENVVSDRFVCGIVEAFPCSITSQTGGDPMPTWLSGWTLFLEALSYSSPVQFFDAIRANVDLLCDLPAQELSVMVSRASAGLPIGHRMDGWRDFVLGSVSFSNVPKASRHFLAAAKHASKSLDRDLFSRAAFWICACETLRGRVEEAEGLATEGLGHVKGSGASNESLLTTAKATALLHMGRYAESREMMANTAGSGAKTVFEHDQQEALRAYYLATTGYEAESMRLIENLRKDSSHHPGGRVGILTELSCAAVETAASPWVVVDTIEPRTRILEAAGQHHSALYAIETLVSALARCNLKSEARSKFIESRRLRGRLGISYSAWDRRRLAPFVVA